VSRDDLDSPAKHIIDLYERHAHDWDRERTRHLMEKPWFDRFIPLLPPRASVLDLGCGSGEPIAKHFVEQGFAVTGIDSSATMISICRQRFPAQEWLVADMRTLSLGKKFAGIIAWNSFFHLSPEDQRRMFPVFKQHAAEEAALLFTSGPSHGEAIGIYQGKPLYHGSLDPAEYRSLLQANGFSVVMYVAEDPDCGRHCVWLARRQQ
jgi:SAM-dependent methyltransferase